MASQGKGQWVSDTAYNTMVPVVTGAAFGPGQTQPFPDALLITNTLTALTIVDINGNSVVFAGTFPASGSILLLSPASITFAPVASVAALYR